MKTSTNGHHDAGDEENPTIAAESRHSSSADGAKGQSTNKNKKLWILLLVGVIAVLGVTGVVLGVLLSDDNDDDDGDSSSSPAIGKDTDTTPAISPTITPINSPTPEPTAIILTPVQQQINWVLSAVNGEEELSRDSIAEHFSEVFRNNISTEDLTAILQSLSAQNQGKPVIVLGTLGETEYSAAVLIGAEGSNEDDQLQMTLIVMEKPPYLINTLVFQEPPKGLDVIPESFSELADQLSNLAAGSTYLAAEIVNGECEAITGSYNQDTAVPLGSTFKLYVLGALAQFIIASNVTSWTDTTIPIQEKLKSLPTGTMQDEAAGTEFTLLEYAQKMIHISDNTATDHLIDFLGREQIESMQAELGHQDPSLNVPFLTTGDMFRIKAGLDDAETTEYLSLDVDEKRQFLTKLADELDIDSLDLSVFSSPRFINSVEWFGSPNDICRAFVGLGELTPLAGEDEMQSILEFGNSAALRGDDEETSPWEFVGYKGGSEAGVIMLAFVADRSDGRRFVQVLSLADEEKRVDDRQAFLLAIEGFRLLASVS